MHRPTYAHNLFMRDIGTSLEVSIVLYILSIVSQYWFLPRDASAERGDATVSRLSVCLSVRPSVRNV